MLQQTKSGARSQADQKMILFPVKGWITNAPITGMPTDSALRLQNWIVRPDGLHLRDGLAKHATGITGQIKSLIGFGSKLFAGQGSSLFDVSEPTDFPAAPLFNMHADDWQGVTLANDGGPRLVVMNSSPLDSAHWYEGTTWRGCDITGVDGRNLICPLHHVRRLFAIERETATVWYLPPKSVQGKASPVFFAPHLTKGGNLVAIAAISGDASKDAQDQLVAVSANGEVVIYAGADPDNAQTWQHVGTWAVPKPVGSKPFTQMGGSLGLMTVDGLIDVPGGLPNPDAKKVIAAHTTPIYQAWLDAVASRGSGQIWEGVDVLGAGLMVINCVRGNQPARQLVLCNDAWSEFTGIDATSVAQTTDGLFFGMNDGTVLKYTGSTDYDAENDTDVPVRGVLAHAYNKLGVANRKFATRGRLQMTAPQPYRAYTRLISDFRSTLADIAARWIANRHWYWDEISWPMQPADWERESTPAQRQWRSMTGSGQNFSLLLAVAANCPVIYTGTDIMFQKGGPL